MNSVTPKETATVLAALRLFQSTIGIDSEGINQMPHFIDHDPLTAEEVDDLCERIVFDIPATSNVEKNNA